MSDILFTIGCIVFCGIFIFAIIYQALYVNKTCPYCKQTNHKAATVCSKCGRDMNPPNPPIYKG